MTSKFVDEEKKDFSEVNLNSEIKISEKKPLKSILSTYLKEKTDEKAVKKSQEEFFNIKNKNNKTKTSFEVLFDLQNRFSKAYKETQNEKFNKNN